MVSDADERLMTALCDEHADALFSFARRYTRDRTQAEDVVQETLLRAWRHLDRLDAQQGNARAYLMTVARNVITDQWRRDQRRPRLVTDEGTLLAQHAPKDLDGAVEGWVIAEALRRLTDDHRAVVQALYYDGNTIKEAAIRLGVPPGTVKSRSYYAVRALRATLEEMGELT